MSFQNTIFHGCTTLLVICAWLSTAASVARTEEEATLPKWAAAGKDWLTPGAFVSDDETGQPPTGNQTLLLFCEEGYLIDRGIANTPFAGPAETWIINQLSQEAPFRKMLKLSEEQAAALRRAIAP